MHTNRLAGEASPYLLQHAHNPVDWFPWGAEAFEKARREDKPIFLSIGYSTCHWCHVMERESFEDMAIADLLNRHFVSIKLDREERPDLDRVYMAYVQAVTGRGGWPMSVWLTPQLEPFFGGTYFPPQNRNGHPGFGGLLEQIASAWKGQRDEVAETARRAVGQLREYAVSGGEGGAAIDGKLLDEAYLAFERVFDPHHGGFGGSPKFPRPSAQGFLLRYSARTGKGEARAMALETLDAIARGGIRDHLGGGFHRYSVDNAWRVPHFEKMLYDQAQLASSYIEAFQSTGNPVWAATARGTLDYVLRDMAAPEGGFYSAEDADSAGNAAEPGRKGEGAYYVWSAAAIREAVPEPEYAWFAFRYGVEEAGNVAHDPQGELAGSNVLFEAHTVAETALHFGVSETQIESGLARAAGVLLDRRALRPRPQRDEKVLAGWNGLMISALAQGATALAEPRYLDAARKAARFLTGAMFDPSSGTLLRRWARGEAAIAGLAEDYALLAQAMLDLYEATFEDSYLNTARRLMRTLAERFADDQGSFYASEAGASDLVLRLTDDADGAEPAASSVAALNLLRLAALTGEEEYERAAGRTLSAFAGRLEAIPTALPVMLSACEFFVGGAVRIAIAGERGAADSEALARAVYTRFVPNRALLLIDRAAERTEIARQSPAPAESEAPAQGARAYVCRGTTCQLPVSGADGLGKLLEY